MAVFNKKKTEQLPIEVLAGILDAQESDQLVVRGEECGLLYLNRQAKSRLVGPEKYLDNCRGSYARHFERLCDYCPLGGWAGGAFQLKSADDRLFAGYSAQIPWLDGESAALLTMRDISEGEVAREKLYKLAYTDQLTGAPNRQRLREDFDAMAGDIASGRVAGVLAIFDLDNFKAVNDTYGHTAGDIMLHRLVEHLQADRAFAGHLYRLGGDEFVLLYSGPASAYPAGELEGHYATVLSGALTAYTLPNIELTCTISIGAAFFPRHGAGFSEVLRKADIALYKAKAEGRARLAVFEDRHDSARKFKDLYINIQPILTQRGVTYGYELVDRGDENTHGERNVNLSTELDRALDALGTREMNSGEKYFITYSSQLLNKTVRDSLPPSKYIIQVPATERPSPKRLAAYRDLAAAGYQLSLVGATPDNLSGELGALVKFVKFARGVDASVQRRLIAKYPEKWFIGTGVDNQISFDTSRQRGFKLFQGYYFKQPVEVRKTKDLDPLKANYLRLLALTGAAGYSNFTEISGIIASDVALSYKLLRLLNSAAVGLRNQISSVEMAVAYLGEESLKKWVALLALRGVADDKPLELVRLSLIRAQFGELLAGQMRPPRNSQHVFLVGLFSLLDVALDQPMADVVAEIALATEIRTSLLGPDGPHSDLLGFFANYEYANWDEVTRFAQGASLSDRQVNEAYLAATRWFGQLAGDV